MYYNIFSAKSKINLSPDFRFCHDKSRYMVYIDGVRIPSNMWELNIMSNESNKAYGSDGSDSVMEGFKELPGVVCSIIGAYCQLLGAAKNNSLQIERYLSV